MIGRLLRRRSPRIYASSRQQAYPADMRWRVGSDEHGWVALDLEAGQLIINGAAVPLRSGTVVRFFKAGEQAVIEVVDDAGTKVASHSLPLREGFYRPLRQLAETAQVVADRWSRRKLRASPEALIDELRGLKGDERRRAWERLKTTLEDTGGDS